MTIDPSSPLFNANSNNANVAGLQSFQSTIPNYFDTSGITNSTNQLNTNILTSGTQAANAAGRSYSQSNMAQGGDASLGGVAAAQSLMPVYGQISQNEQGLNAQKLQASEQEGSLAGQVATSLASLKTNYLASLMGYTGSLQAQQQQANTAAAGRALQSSEFQTSAQLQRQGLGIQQQQANTSSAAQQSTQKLGALQLLAQLPQQGYAPSVTVNAPGAGYSSYTSGTPINNNPGVNSLRNTLYGLV